MRLTYKTPDGRVTFEGEVKQALEGFAVVAKLDLLFNTEKACGCCTSANIGPLVRYPKGYVYYDIECHDCGARINIHQNKDGGGLYFARHEAADTNGWSKWEGGQEDRGDDQRRDSYAGGGQQQGNRQQTTHPRQGQQQGGKPAPQQGGDNDGDVPF